MYFPSYHHSSSFFYLQNVNIQKFEYDYTDTTFLPIFSLLLDNTNIPYLPIIVKNYSNHNKITTPIPPSVSGPFLYLFSSKNGIFHKFLYRTFWYSRNYTYFYFPKWRYKPRMVLKITNLHILRYLPTYWLYLLERYTIDNQRCTHTASDNRQAP